MSKNFKSKNKCNTPYMPEEMLPEKEPDYKELYFSLLRDIFKLKDCIDKITGKSIRKMNEGMPVFELSPDDDTLIKK